LEWLKLRDKECGVEVTFNAIIYRHNCIEIHLLSCSHVKSLTVSHFGMIEAMGLENMTSRWPSTSWHPHKISSKSTNQFKSCTHLRCLNVRHLAMVEATGLSSMESKSSSMSSPPYKISSKSTNWIKSYLGVSLHPPQKF
jgi:hypothetical protein